MASERDTQRELVAKERQRVKKLEDDLRRTLLRGMTAMNMEAMHLFQASGTPSDIGAGGPSRHPVAVRGGQGP